MAQATNSTVLAETISWPHQVTYRVITPVLILLGVVSSTTSIVVLRQPALHSLQVNRYFQVLSWCDLLVFLSHILVAVGINGCDFDSEWSAWYFAHFGWTVTEGFHSYCTYIITWLAMDRSLAVWRPTIYKNIKKPRVRQIRAWITATVCFTAQIIFILNASVSPAKEADMEECRAGQWVINYGHQEDWHKGYRWFSGILIWLLPILLLTTFNLSLVVAVCQGRARSYGSSETTNTGRSRVLVGTWEQNLIFTMIAMCISVAGMNIPMIVFLTSYAKKDVNHCCEINGVESLRHMANIFQLLDHLVHPVFLFCLNPNFRQELLAILQLVKKRARCSNVVPTENGTTDTSTTTAP